jgi:hypothetical protein
VAGAAAWEVGAGVAMVVWWFVPVSVINPIVTTIATSTPSAPSSAPGVIRNRGVLRVMLCGVDMVCSVCGGPRVRPGGLMGRPSSVGAL